MKFVMSFFFTLWFCKVFAVVECVNGRFAWFFMEFSL